MGQKTPLFAFFSDSVAFTGLWEEPSSGTSPTLRKAVNTVGVSRHMVGSPQTRAQQLTGFVTLDKLTSLGGQLVHFLFFQSLHAPVTSCKVGIIVDPPHRVGGRIA